MPVTAPRSTRSASAHIAASPLTDSPNDGTLTLRSGLKRARPTPTTQPAFPGGAHPRGGRARVASPPDEAWAGEAADVSGDIWGGPGARRERGRSRLSRGGCAGESHIDLTADDEDSGNEAPQTSPSRAGHAQPPVASVRQQQQWKARLLSPHETPDAGAAAASSGPPATLGQPEPLSRHSQRLLTKRVNLPLLLSSRTPPDGSALPAPANMYDSASSNSSGPIAPASS